jgi:hypothetical protein
MDTVIESTERPHTLREHGCGGRVNRVPSFTVWELAEGAAPGTSEIRVTFWTEPSHPVDRIRDLFGAARPFRRGWRRALARLKEVAESGRELERVEVAGGDRLAAF